MAMTWRDIAEKVRVIGIPQAEFARRAGMPEDTFRKGVARNSTPRPSVRRMLADALQRVENEQQAEQQEASHASGQ